MQEETTRPNEIFSLLIFLYFSLSVSEFNVVSWPMTVILNLFDEGYIFFFLAYNLLEVHRIIFH